MSEELVSGFDARDMVRRAADIFILGNQNSYLLRDGIHKPLSTDVMIWDSVVDQIDVNGRTLWTGTPTTLWHSVPRLMERLDQQAQPAAAFWTIGVTILANRAADFWASHNLDPTAWLPVNPSQPEETWAFLGYDVSDRYLLSGLSNCGKDADEIPTMRQHFGPYLNEHHLFTSAEPALDYKKWADQDTGHAPFFIYGLYCTG